MNDSERLELQREILILEDNVKKLQKNADRNKTIKAIRANLVRLKDIAWDKNSKKEAGNMYQVFTGNKQKTIVKSNIGEVVVDRWFIEKEQKKHLNDSQKRGMITTEEMLSFPKVAKNVEPKLDKQHNSNVWNVEANDGNMIKYAERMWDNERHLLTVHSKTERGERGYPHRQFYNPDCNNSVPDENMISKIPLNDDEK